MKSPFPENSNNFTLVNILNYVSEEQDGDVLKQTNWRRNTSKTILKNLVEESLTAIWHLNLANALNRNSITKTYAAEIRDQAGFMNSEFNFKLP